MVSERAGGRNDSSHRSALAPPGPRATRRYDLGGIDLEVSSVNALLLRALDRRLGPFGRDDAPRKSMRPDLAFDFYSVDERIEPPVELPSGPSRPIYEPGMAEVHYFPGTDEIFLEYPDRVRVLADLARGRARIAAAGREDDLWLLSHLALTLPLVEMAKRRGWYSVHAAGLVVNGRAIICPGKCGAGKTTLTIALARAGFGFLGDDLVFLVTESTDDDCSASLGYDGVSRNRTIAPRLTVRGFPDEIDVADGTAALFPELHHLLESPRTPGWPKHAIRAEDVYQTELVRASQPAVLLFPTIGDPDTSTIEPIDPSVAFLELVPNVLLTDPTASQAHLDALAALARSCACYHLAFGRDFDALPELIARLTLR